MTWKVRFRDKARKELRRLDQPGQQRILRFLRQRIATEEDPRRLGKALTARKKGLWRYRVGPYRLICRINKNRFAVLVVAVGHRKDIYE